MGREPDLILPFSADGRAGPAQWPHWDADLRHLFFGAERVKAFTSPAENQEAILAAFEASGWRRVIDNPLAGAGGGRRQLEYAVRRLNGNQRPVRLRFCVCEYGHKIAWAPSAAQLPARKRRPAKGKRPKKTDG